MKKLTVFLLAFVLCLLPATASMASEAGQTTAFSVIVYDTDNEGLSLKTSPDINSARITVIPENTPLSIDRVSGGWGHTNYNGQTGWVALTYTQIKGVYPAQAPDAPFGVAVDYQVVNTDNEGLELRNRPTTDSPTYGPVPEGTMVKVEGLQDKWAYASYNGNFGWLHTAYLRSTTFQVFVCNTENEGLSLKASADINSDRLATIPENTHLVIDTITGSWGHTSFNGQSGWVALRYTLVAGGFIAEAPTYGYINPINYTVVNTTGEGLELRTRPTVETSTFGTVPEGTSIRVEAIQGDWAYGFYNGNYGWLNTTYLYNGSFQVNVYNTDNEGLALKEAASLDSGRILMIPENTPLTIDQISGSWGHTWYGGKAGWVALQYTRVQSNYISQAPTYGFREPAIYLIHDTGREGLQLRTKPTIESSTYGAIPDQTEIRVEAIQDNWAYAWYNGIYGWVNTFYIRP